MGLCHSICVIFHEVALTFIEGNQLTFYTQNLLKQLKLHIWNVILSGILLHI
jgi:hypothetical protein